MIEEKVLAIAKKKCDEADISLWKNYSSRVSYKSNEINGIFSDESECLSLRIIKNGRLGISYSYDMKSHPEKIVDKAIFSAKYGPKCFFSLPEKVKHIKNINLYHPPTVEMKTGKMKDFIEQEIKKMIYAENDLMVDSGLSKSVVSSRFLNTSGTDYSINKTNSSFFIVGKRNQEGDFLNIGEGVSSRRFDNDSLVPAKKVAELFKLSGKTKSISTGKYDVYLDREVFRYFIGTILSGLNGKSVLMGSSYFGDKLGKDIFDKRIYLYEDPFINWAVSSCAMDSEGVATTKKDFIKNGCPQNFIYDLQTAAKAKMGSTGNGFRGSTNQANPIYTNVVMKEGEKSEKDIIKSIKNGLYIKSVMGGHTNDPHSGNLSLQGELVFRVEDGKIIGRVKNTMMFLNVFEVLKSNLVEISKDRQWEGNKYLPGVHLKNISITGK